MLTGPLLLVWVGLSCLPRWERPNESFGVKGRLRRVKSVAPGGGAGKRPPGLPSAGVYSAGIPGSCLLAPPPPQSATSAQGGAGVWVCCGQSRRPGASVPCAFVSRDTMGGFCPHKVPFTVGRRVRAGVEAGPGQAKFRVSSAAQMCPCEREPQKGSCCPRVPVSWIVQWREGSSGSFWVGPHSHIISKTFGFIANI